MIRKLERWVWVGGAFLALNGGIINAVGLSSLARQTLSHVTGTTTLLSIAFVHADARAIAHLGLILGAFFAGAAVAGFVIQDGVLKLGRRYAVALWIECGILLLAVVTITGRPGFGLCLAAAACGLQNAIASTYSGATLRTTHMTGIVTDLGAAAGYLLRGTQIDWLRVRFHGLLLAAFVGGAMVGAVLFSSVSYRALWIPVGLTSTLAVVYQFFVRGRVVRGGKSALMVSSGKLL